MTGFRSRFVEINFTIWKNLLLFSFTPPLSLSLSMNLIHSLKFFFFKLNFHSKLCLYLCLVGVKCIDELPVYSLFTVVTCLLWNEQENHRTWYSHWIRLWQTRAYTAGILFSMNKSLINSPFSLYSRFALQCMYKYMWSYLTHYKLFLFLVLF